MRAAYDALPDRTKQELEGLVAEHSIWRSREQLGVVKYSAEELASLPPVPQRVVRTIPARIARRSTSHRTPRTFSAGPSPTVVCS